VRYTFSRQINDENVNIETILVVGVPSAVQLMNGQFSVTNLNEKEIPYNTNRTLQAELPPGVRLVDSGETRFSVNINVELLNRPYRLHVPSENIEIINQRGREFEILDEYLILDLRIGAAYIVDFSVDDVRVILDFDTASDRPGEQLIEAEIFFRNHEIGQVYELRDVNNVRIILSEDYGTEN
jgi:hypothetical protein